jgi:hypothetical protein
MAIGELAKVGSPIAFLLWDAIAPMKKLLHP